MAFWDRFINRKKLANKKRNFYASNNGRLYGDWLSGNTSPDAELQNNLKLMRDRARDLARNNGIVTRYLQIMKEGVVGNAGFKIKLHARDSDGTLDDTANDIIESNWYAWGSLLK